MLCVQGSPLYQWDKDRQLKIDSVSPDANFTVHCCHKDDTTALVVPPIIKDNEILVNIPNILLQESGIIQVYVVIEGDTVYDTSLYVLARPKPADYIYEETEVLNITSVVERALKEAKDRGDFDGKPGHTPQKGVDYFTEDEKVEFIETIKSEYLNDVEEVLDIIISEQYAIIKIQNALLGGISE